MRALLEPCRPARRTAVCPVCGAEPDFEVYERRGLICGCDRCIRIRQREVLDDGTDESEPERAFRRTV